MLSFITPQALRALADARAVQRATVVADKDVYKVTVQDGSVERLLSVRTREGKTKERVFTSLDSVASFMREKVHISQYDVNVSNLAHGAVRSKRPDTSARLQGAHAALSHALWLQAKVSAAREGLADGSNQRIDAQEWARIRAAKQAKRQTA